MGRASGSLARHRRSSGASPSGTPARSGSLWTTWYATTYGLFESKGPRPVAACTSMAPIANTSAAGPTSRGRWNCSGAMNGGVPISRPVSVRTSLSLGREMPKSMTFGPSAARRTLLGFRSRWTTPARWMSRSASASPAPSLRSSAASRGPFRLTRSDSVGPSVNRVAIQGRAASGSASTTGAVNAPLTRRAASTSCRKRALNSGSAACSRWITFTARRSPESDLASRTTPMPPEPSQSSSRYLPAYSGCSASGTGPELRSGGIVHPRVCSLGRATHGPGARDARSLVDDACDVGVAC
ncbi:hypothetical protein K701_21710 [Streptomyces fradiae ATCC 10745 = DSM 40063]|uniref:Uncharacterized protein n=1 Tax=Streptomyces fradiae ATCC 10745 = DSM 40063 TaxID=1319510 RepID=A0ABQ6XPZ4_STRFR|nr:hypothetical protein K701_21710 [Streptomyces fradiae ATCC 10745 = DSM 40063]